MDFPVELFAANSTAYLLKAPYSPPYPLSFLLLSQGDFFIHTLYPNLVVYISPINDYETSRDKCSETHKDK